MYVFRLGVLQHIHYKRTWQGGKMVNENIIKKTYNRLQDNVSRCIYEKRLLYSLTGDKNYLYSLVGRNTRGGELLQKTLQEHEDKPKVLFGAGFWGRRLRSFFPEAGWTCFVDNKLSPGTEVDGFPVVSVKELSEKYSDAFVVISTRLYYQQIKEQLLENGFSQDNICVVGEWQNEMLAQQYFDPDIMTCSEGEAFVDGGAFDGQTSLAFRKWAKGKYANIWAFEPEGEMAVKCRELLKNFQNVSIINKGLWKEAGCVSFQSDGVLSTVSEHSDKGNKIPVAALDEVLKDKRVTFIKLDVEGSELEALQGAERIIREQKPKLAISVYHKPQDIWELPELIMSYGSDYKFYLRHYTLCEYDSVLYAV